MEKFLFGKVERWYAFLLILIVFISLWLMGTLALISVTRLEHTVYSSKLVRFFMFPRTVFEILTGDDDTRFAIAELPDIEFNALSKTASSDGFAFGRLEKSEGEVTAFTIFDGTTGAELQSWPTNQEALAVSEFDNTLLVAGQQQGFKLTDRIAKVTPTGEILWNVDIKSHHDVHVATDGTIYTPIIYGEYDGRPRDLYKGLYVYRDDGYAILSPEGEVLDRRSLSEILTNNGLEHLITGVGPIEQDPIHLNTVKVAEEARGIYREGDLLMSLRHLSMVLLYRPSTDTIIWYSLGPWTNQHDPDFLADGRISVFGNDVASSYFNRVQRHAPLINGQNEIYIIDPATGEIETPFTEAMANVGIATVTAGVHEILDDGSLVVHFSNQGVLSRLHADGRADHYALVDGTHTDLANGLDILFH